MLVLIISVSWVGNSMGCITWVLFVLDYDHVY